MKKFTTKREKPEADRNRIGGLRKFGLVKILSLILCAALLITTLVACGNGEENGYAAEEPADVSDEAEYGDGSDEDEEDISVDDPVEEADGELAANLEASMTAFGRNDVMMSAGGQDIIWAELYIFIYSTVANLTGFFSTPVDWSVTIADEMTLADMVIEQATENALAFLTFRYGAANLGISLSQDEIDEIDAGLQSFVDSFGGREEFRRALREEYGFYDYEVYESIVLTESLVGVIMNELYGEFASELPDEVAADFANSNDYMMAKHILVMSADNESARDEIDEIYNRLRPRAGDADFEDFFSEMMLEYSEDPGSIANPGGYLFQPWDMVEPFSNAAMLLSPGEMSDVVETSFGYHIILRIPIDYNAVPISVAAVGQTHTLRQIAASEDFESIISQWREEMDVEFSALFNSIDLARLFGWLEE